MKKEKETIEVAEEAIQKETKKKTSTRKKKEIETVEKPKAVEQKGKEEFVEEKAEENSIEVKTPAIVKPKILGDFGGFKTKEAEEDLKPKAIINRKTVEKYEALKKANEVIWAKVVGSELDKKIHSVGIVCDLGDGQRAIIPDTLYFMPETQFDEKYDQQNDAEKARIRQKFASYQIGAIICFTIFSISTDEKVGLTIFGNRVDAMNKLQDFYFTHEHYPQTESNTIAVGDKTKARVLTVRAHKLFVECCGVETFLSPYYLSNEVITNCRDLYKPGDVIEVEIRKLYTEPKNYLSLSARFMMAKEKMQQIVKGSTYLGTVERIDAQKGTVSVRLSNGLNVSVLRDRAITIDPKTLAKGDRVIVEITKIMDSFAQGFIFAKC